MAATDSTAVRVVVPAYNEGSNAWRIANAVREALPGVPLDFLDDASTDSESRASLDRAAAETSITVVRASERRGKAENLRLAICNAAAANEALVVLDCDISAPAETLRALYNGVGEADLTVAAALALSPPRSTVERALIYAARFHNDVRQRLERKRPAFCVIGRAFALSAQAVRLLATEQFPEHTEDAYIALRLLKHGYTIRLLAGNPVYYRAPATLADHQKQSHRFSAGIQRMQQLFGATFVSENLAPPASALAISFVSTGLRDPVGAILYVAFTVQTRLAAENADAQSGAGWATSETTKAI